MPNIFKVKAEHQVSSSKLCSLENPELKWDRTMIDSILGLPTSAFKKNVVCVIMDRLTQSTHFVAV